MTSPRGVVELQAARERAEAPPRRRRGRLPVQGSRARSTSTTPTSSSGASGWSPRWSRALAGAPLLGIVGPSGSGKSSALRAACCRRSREGVLPGSERLGGRAAAPGEHPLARARAGDRRGAAGRPAGRRGRPVRGGLHRLPRRGGADRVRRRARRGRARPAPPRARADRAARGLLRPLREPTRSCRACSAPTTSWSARCAATSCAARSSCPRGAPACSVEPELVDALIADVEGEPGALPLLSTSLLELWQQRDGRRLRMRAYEQAGGVRGAVARLAERAYERLDARAAARRARAMLLRLAGAGEGDAVVRRRVPLAELERATASPTCSTCSPTSRLRDGRRGRGRGRPRGAAARVAAAARLARGGRRGPPPAPPAAASPRASGTPAGATPASSTAARGSPPRSTGRPTTTPSSTPPSASSSTRAGPRASARSAACAPSWRASPRCSCSPWSPASSRSTSAAARATQATAADAQRLGLARRSSRTTSTARCCSRARASRSTTGADARQPARRADQEPGRDRRHARRRRAHLGARAQPRRAHARRGRPGRQRLPVRHAVAAARRAAPDVHPGDWSIVELAYSPDGRRLAIAARQRRRATSSRSWTRARAASGPRL